MKREELKSLGLTDEQIDKVMAANGADIETHKSATTKANTDLQAAKDQLAEANKQIEAFKEMKPEDLKKAAEDYKSKYDKLVEDHAAETKQHQFDSALEKGLAEAKAKNPKALKGLLDLTNLKYNEADGSLVGLKEQIEKIKPENDYLFESAEDAEPTPEIVASAKTTPTKTSTFEAAMLKGAGLKAWPTE